MKKADWKKKVLHELIEYWLTVAYLAVYFGVFTMYRRLILAHYEINYLNYGFALFEALILSKVILIGDVLRLSRGFENRPLLLPTLFRAVLFTLWVLVFRLLENMFRGLLRGEGLMGGLAEMVGKGKYELTASCLVVFFTFIPFFALRELRRVMGEGCLWKLFFQGPAAAGFGPRPRANPAQAPPSPEAGPPSMPEN